VSLAKVAIDKRTVTVFATVLALVAGLLSYFNLGQLEDPEFTVKTAVIVTPYPGARADEVELEVTDRLELALQDMSQIRYMDSYSSAGMSLISVDIWPKYSSEDLPQVWDELRKKIRDARDLLPPGAGTPVVSDDFGDVFGFLFAVVGDGFTNAQLEGYVDAIKKELSLVEGVSRVVRWGVQPQCLYIDVSEARISQLGLTFADVQQTLLQQNVVVDGGGVDINDQRLRLETTGEFSSPEEVANLVIRGGVADAQARSELITIGDIGTVRRGYLQPPSALMRYDGMPAIVVAASNLSGVNAVDLGAAIDRRLAELIEDLPVGIEIKHISWQSDLVSTAIADFMVSLMQAIAIVLIVLWVAMGWRTALIVGLSGLVFTIVITFLFMDIMGEDLERMSLGALVIAMGMMVDNAIVVADGILVRIQRGMDRVKAAIEAATQPAIPLLGATVVAVLAFYPIAVSDEAAGEYCASLFSVVSISLIVSWVLSVTITPVMCIAFLPKPKASASGDVYGGRFYSVFRGLLRLSMRLRWLVILIFVALLVLAGIGFGFVNQLFFPASARAQFMIDYWAPEGTRIQAVSAGLRPLEAKLLDDPRVTAVSAFIGQGPPRFYLPVDPESASSSYGQLIVNVHSFKEVQSLLADLKPWCAENIPEAQIILRRYGLGPFESWPIEARFSGPAVADPDVLRDLAGQATAILRASPHADVVQTSWRERTQKVVADFHQENARWTNITRADIARATQRGYDGSTVGLFREKEKLLPILVRLDEAERKTFVSQIDTLQVRSLTGRESVPLSQVTRSIRVEWEDAIIARWDRRRAITAQAVPSNLASELQTDVKEAIEAIELPPGYTLEWDGELKSSADAQASLIPGMIPAVVIMALIVVGLFNACRPPLIIVCVIPFALIGVTAGLLATGQPFGFVALLGAMSLVGMMIKNSIVLLDQVNIELAEDKSPYDAVVEAAVSRLRPVMLAAATTVLGVIPLLPDVFWVAMAVTIMFGLAFGTVLTMVLIPVLYATFFRVKVP